MAGRKGKSKKKDKGKKQSDTLKLILASVEELSTKLMKLEEEFSALKLTRSRASWPTWSTRA